MLCFGGGRHGVRVRPWIDDSIPDTCACAMFDRRALLYTVLSKKIVIVNFQTFYLTSCLIKNFYINIIYFDMTYLIIKDILIMIYLFTLEFV